MMMTCQLLQNLDLNGRPPDLLLDSEGVVQIDVVTSRRFQKQLPMINNHI